MISYYTANIILCVLTLGILAVLTQENARLPGDRKRSLYLTYFLLIAAALAEWAGLQLNGRVDSPVWVLKMVKCADYICTPMIGGALIGNLGLRDRSYTVLAGVLLANTLFQLVSLFTGWMIRIDAQHQYAHGALYPVYIAAYLAVILLVIIQLVRYGKKFRKRNKLSLYLTLCLILAGIAMQELPNVGLRTGCIALAFAACLMFIHISEYQQLSSDDTIHTQRTQIFTDPLTGLLSRYAFSEALKEYGAMDMLPEKLAVFYVDINGLKEVNDSKGHTAGDEIIQGAATCIRSVFGEDSKCYRTGGDEFILIAQMDHREAEQTLEDLTGAAAHWRGSFTHHLSLASGYVLAEDHRDSSAEKLIMEAVQRMYACKAAYYSGAGRDRRRRAEDHLKQA